MDYLDKLEKRISHISILDIISSKIRKHPSSINEYSAEWDRNLSDFLDTNPEVVHIDKYRMKLSNNNKNVTLWIANYPFSYAYRYELNIEKFTPSWDTILRVRKIQAAHKNMVLDKAKEDMVI